MCNLFDDCSSIFSDKQQIIVNGSWGEWGSWTSCNSRTGTQTSSRECYNPNQGGSECSGNSQKQIPCKGTFQHYKSFTIIPFCTLVNGGWSDWGSWSNCDSRTGKRERSRLCNFPSPKNGGYGCSGNGQSQELCAGNFL